MLAVLHGIAVVIFIGGPLWALHPAAGTTGTIVGLVCVAEIHGHLWPLLDRIKQWAAEVREITEHLAD